RRQEETVAHRRRREVVVLAPEGKLLDGATVGRVDREERAAADRPDEAARDDRRAVLTVGGGPAHAQAESLHSLDAASARRVDHGPHHRAATVDVATTH